MLTTKKILERARAAKAAMCSVRGEDINSALLKIADKIVENTKNILLANREDVEASREKLGEVMVDRLMLNEARIASMAKGIREVAELSSPVGSTISTV